MSTVPPAADRAARHPSERLMPYLTPTPAAGTDDPTPVSAQPDIAAPTHAVLDEIAQERSRQDAKWGEQNHPDGTGAHLPWIGKAFRAQAPTDKQDRGTYREWARFRCQEFAKAGNGTWENILTEEWAEAVAEEEPSKLRAEMVQVAAVAVAWIEAIDRRLAAQIMAALSEPTDDDPHSAQVDLTAGWPALSDDDTTDTGSTP